MAGIDDLGVGWVAHFQKPQLIHQFLEPEAAKKYLRRSIQKTSASVSSGVPNTEKQMKARGRRPSAFIVLRCLEHEARVFWYSFLNELPTIIVCYFCFVLLMKQ